MTKAKWSRNLYSKQPFPDNHFDESLLEQMQMNANVKEAGFDVVLCMTASIAQQICLMLIYFSVFAGTRAGDLSIEVLGWMDLILPTATYIMLRSYYKMSIELCHVLGNSLLYVATLSILSPILGTLTQTYADDTIWALGTILAFIHILCYDYTYIYSGIGSFSGKISINAAMFSAVIQASRLQPDMHVIGFLLLAIELFGMLPVLQCELKRHSGKAYFCVTAALCAVSEILAWRYLSVAVCIMSGMLIFFLIFLAPLLFLHAQEHKNEILGPWDIAIVEEKQQIIGDES